jgi:predicted AlkP superfamily phosphohydrolase/phosphomutase
LQIKGDRGQEMNNQIYFTRELFDGKYADYAPDIFVYFDNLITGTNSEIGNNKLYSNETQIGKDDAGHAPLGIFVIKDSENKIRGNLGNVSIYDVMPTILKELNLEIPKNLRGTPIENEQN